MMVSLIYFKTSNLNGTVVILFDDKPRPSAIKTTNRTCQ